MTSCDSGDIAMSTHYFTAQMSSVARQNGMATIASALVLLVLVTMVIFYTSRTILLEQKITANDFRTKQAFEAAESGLQIALGYLASSGGEDKNGDGVIDAVFDTNADGVGDTNTMTFADNSSVEVTLTGAYPSILVQADGFSDDRTAGRTIRALGSVADAIPNVPGNPISSKSGVVIDGSATVYNPEGHSTIWSGSDVELGSNNSTGTEIADPDDAGYPTCMDTSMTCGTTRSSTKTNVGLDVVEYDTSLGMLSNEELFQNFFGLSSTNYRSSRVTLEVDGANANNAASDATPGIHLAIGEVVWVEGDTELANITTVGCGAPVNGGNVCSNADVDPSIVIVNGDLTTNGTPQFYGLVFVLGDLNMTGNSAIHGAVVIADETDVSTGGSLDVWYNSDLLDAARNNGQLASAPGSWRDW